LKQKITSAMICAGLLASMLPMTSMAEPVVPEIYEDFNSTIAIGANSTEQAWTYSADYHELVMSDGLFGRETDEDDKSLRWSNNNAWVNYLLFFPENGEESSGDGKDWCGADVTIPTGTVMETSFLLAVEPAPASATKSGSVEIGWNCMTDSSPISFVMSHGSGIVSTLKHNGEEAQTVAVGLSDNGTKWHEVSFLTRYDANNVGESALFIDGVQVGTNMVFSYNQEAHAYGNGMGTHPNDQLHALTIRNTTHRQNPDKVYLDDLRIGELDKSALAEAVEEIQAKRDRMDTEEHSKVAVDALDKKLAEVRLLAQGTSLVPETAFAGYISALENALKTAEESLPDGEDVSDITSASEDFDGEYSYGSRWDPNAVWAFLQDEKTMVSSNGLFGRVADADDLTVKWTNTNPWGNHLYYLPQRDTLDDFFPRGVTAEVSLDFAVEPSTDTAGTTVETIEIAVNPGMYLSHIIIPHKTATIQTVKSMNDGFEEAVNFKLNPDGVVTWHHLSFLLRFDDDDKGIGTAAVFIDGEPLCSTYQFSYSESEFALGEQFGNWKQNSIYGLFIKNLTHASNPDNLYFDNVKIQAVASRKSEYRAIIKRAEELLGRCVVGDEMGEYLQEDVDELKALLADAYSVYNGAESDYEGNITGEATMYPSNVIDGTLEALRNALTEIPERAHSDILTLEKSGGKVVAEYQRLSYLDASYDRRLMLVLYDEKDIVVGIVYDDGDGTLSFTDVDEENGEIKSLKAEANLSDYPNAKTARAYIWNSMGEMNYIVPGAEKIL